MSKLKTPIICTIIGEGGSGGALAIGVGDRLIMLEYSTYSVISPEGCAAILWKSPDKVQLAAEAMGITADRIREQGFLDEVVREPLGGAHRDFKTTALNLKDTLLRHLDTLKHQDTHTLLENRYQRIMSFGVFEEVGK
jgi:acetyl-CoA carboxylase carboxyl transferase subunit alpha